MPIVSVFVCFAAGLFMLIAISVMLPFSVYFFWIFWRKCLDPLPGFLRGVYFLRFAITLWIFPLLLAYLDFKTPAAAITRGIMTPETGPQAASATFMLFSTGVIALLLTRLIAVNGHERFGEELSEKSWMRQRLGSHRLPVWLFLVAHIPGFVTLSYVGFNMHRERVLDPSDYISLVIGVAIAYLFWLIVGLVYLWSFDPTAFGPREPTGLILPREFVPISEEWLKDVQAEPPPLIVTAIDPLFRLIARIGGAGFASKNSDLLYEGHRLAAVSIFGLLFLYLYLFAFTAPIQWNAADGVCTSIALLGIALVGIGVAWPPWAKTRAANIVKTMVTVLLIGAFVAIIWFWIHKFHAPRGFSVLASVLVLVIGMFWILSSIAFAFDKTRFPVLSGSLILALLLKSANFYSAEHYFTVIKHNEQLSPAPKPAEILGDRIPQLSTLDSNYYSPLIVITAEGGGIHSAAWTANVLMDLEYQFRRLNPARPFDANILLASGVSGGSFGLLPFLREYTANPRSQAFPVTQDPSDNDQSTPANRVVLAAECSSLQAAAWGLTYYDALNFLSPLGIAPPATGTTNTGYDRSWALEQAAGRNLNDQFCFDQYGIDPRKMDPAPSMQNGSDMTLHSASEMLRLHKMPAFTFNTTAVESGGRFLLSNYELPDLSQQNDDLLKSGDQSDFIPAESFLHAFAHDDRTLKMAGHPHKAYADMRLDTAARLSGTFPFVSSASRIPEEISDWGYHFVDGGYFDNDGTSSVVEFLYLALMDKQSQSTATIRSQPPNVPEKQNLKPYPQKLPILLIEIRDDADIDTTNVEESFPNQDNLALLAGTWTPNTVKKDQRSKWGPDHQLGAPLEGFWMAGHSSDSRRNRRELCMLEGAYRDRLSIHHMVFDYRNSEDSNQPLSWDLTPNQRHNIQCALKPTVTGCSAIEGEQNTTKDLQASIDSLAKQAAVWFNDPLHNGLSGDSDVCKSTGLGPLNRNPSQH